MPATDWYMSGILYNCFYPWCVCVCVCTSMRVSPIPEATKNYSYKMNLHSFELGLVVTII